MIRILQQLLQQTYTPTVIPVKPTSTDDESEGPKGQTQNGTPTFTGGKVEVNGVRRLLKLMKMLNQP